jgi:hypothetical protein
MAHPGPGEPRREPGHVGSGVNTRSTSSLP